MTKDKRGPMPKDGISKAISETVRVELMNDFERFTNGHMMMTISKVKIGLAGKELGVIRMEVNGCAVMATIGKRSWSISVKELWPLFAKADEEYMEYGTKGA